MRYAAPSDDLIAVIQPTITGSSEDSAYPPENWLETVNSYATPEKPSKLTETSGYWDFDFGVAVSVAAFGGLFHNLKEGMTWTLKWNSSASFASPAGSITHTTPAVPSDNTTLNFWSDVTGTPTYRYWRLEIGLSGPVNDFPISLGRPLFLGALRTVYMRWPEDGSTTEDEMHELLEPNITVLKVELPIPLQERRRTISCEVGGDDTIAAAMLSQRRATQGRLMPFPLVPFDSVNDMWWVRFEPISGRLVHFFHSYKRFPFVFREVSRGLEWPSL